MPPWSWPPEPPSPSTRGERFAFQAQRDPSLKPVMTLSRTVSSCSPRRCCARPRRAVPAAGRAGMLGGARRVPVRGCTSSSSSAPEPPDSGLKKMVVDACTSGRSPSIQTPWLVTVSTWVWTRSCSLPGIVKGSPADGDRLRRRCRPISGDRLPRPLRRLRACAGTAPTCSEESCASSQAFVGELAPMPSTRNSCCRPRLGTSIFSLVHSSFSPLQ